MSGVVMEFIADGIKVSYDGTNGSTVQKIIDPESLVDALSKQVKFETGLLPKGTKYFKHMEHMDLIVIEYPGHIRQIQFKGGSTFTVPIPPTVHFIHLNMERNQYKFAGSRCFCLVQPLISPATDLYMFPYGNVHSGGDVCWGSIQLPAVKELPGVLAYVDTFFSSVFNGDLGGGTFQTFHYTAEDGTRVEVNHAARLMAYMNGKTDFPMDKLVRTTDFKSMISRYNSRS